MIDLYNDLKNNSYPGRGIVIGKSNNNKVYVAYFIMGRSQNSRNRVFVTQTDGIKTEAFDPSKLLDPSLVIYSPVRALDNYLIVTNGDQTDTIYEFLASNRNFEDALRTREYEPDEPNFTPRISGLITFLDNNFSYKLSILKSADGDGDGHYKFFYEYINPIAGKGHFIHTYLTDGNPIPSFVGEPKTVEIVDDFDTFTSNIWNSLNNENKVSLYTKEIDLITKEETTRILNKNI